MYNITQVDLFTDPVDFDKEAILEHIQNVYSIYENKNNTEDERKAAYLIYAYYNADYILINENQSSVDTIGGQKIKIRDQ